MIPTPAAKTLYPEIIRLLEQEDLLKTTLKQCLSQSGIRFAVPDQYKIGYALKRSIYRYNEKFGTDIECVPVSYSESVTEQDRILLEGECDYRIINRIFNQLDGFYTHALCTISFVPVVNRNNPLASFSDAAWNALRDQEIIVENAEYPYVQQVIATCRKAGFEPNIHVAEGDLFALQMIRREDHAVYFTRHASPFVRDDEQCEFCIPNLSSVISSNYIVQGRKEKWNPALSHGFRKPWNGSSGNTGLRAFLHEQCSVDGGHDRNGHNEQHSRQNIDSACTPDIRTDQSRISDDGCGRWCRTRHDDNEHCIFCNFGDCRDPGNCQNCNQNKREDNQAEQTYKECTFVCKADERQ